MATQVNLFPGESAIEIIADNGLKTYLKKEDIIKVTPVSVEDVFQKSGTLPDNRYKVKVTLADGSFQDISIGNVSNQPTWTADDAGLNQACYDIAQSLGVLGLVNATLDQILMALEDISEYEAKLVVDNNDVTWLEVRVYNTDDGSFDPPVYYLPGSNTPGSPALPISYINPNTYLSQIVANTTGINLEATQQDILTELEAQRPSFDALGATEVSQLTTLLDIKQSGGFPADFITFVEVGTGTHTYDQTTGSTSMSVSSNGDRVIAQTFQRTNYQTGKPKQVKQTLFNFHAVAGVGKRFGYFSADYVTPYTNNLDGFWLENDTVEGLTLNVYRYGTEIIRKSEDEWVGDDYDWSSVDWSKNLLSINRFVWLGVDQVQFAVKIGSQKLVLHTEYFTNTSLQGVFMRHANQPLRWEIWSTGGSGSMNYICATAEKQGSLNQLGKLNSVDRGSSIQNANSTANTYVNIGISLDPTKTNSFRNTVVDVVGATSVALTNDAYLWKLVRCLESDISGTALSWNSVTDSGVRYFVGADNNLLTGGQIIQSGYVAQRLQDKIEVDGSIKLGVDLDGTPDIFVLAIQPLGAKLDVLGTINFRELN